MKKLAAILPGLVLVAACAGAGGRVAEADNPFSEAGATSRSVVIVVDNLQFMAAAVYALPDGGTRRRIGRVPGKQRQRFTLEWAGARDLRVEIRLLASDNFTTRPLTVAGGDQLLLVVEGDVRRSILRRVGGR